MAGLGDMFQKAVYLGIGLASYAGEKAGTKFSELRGQAQKLADEMVERGEMSADEARRFVDEAMHRAQQSQQTVVKADEKPTSEPRRIEILSDDEEPVTVDPNEDALRQQLQDLQDELRRLKQD